MGWIFKAFGIPALSGGTIRPVDFQISMATVKNLLIGQQKHLQGFGTRTVLLEKGWMRPKYLLHSNSPLMDHKKLVDNQCAVVVSIPESAVMQ